jgi:hypothetical protein
VRQHDPGRFLASAGLAIALLGATASARARPAAGVEFATEAKLLLTLVTSDTAGRVGPFPEKLPAVTRRRSLPATSRDLSPAERAAPMRELHSDLGHMEIVTSGKVLPVLLRRSPLQAVKAPPRFTKRKKRQGTDP